MGFGKKSKSTTTDTTQPTVTQVEQRPTDTIQRAAVAERADASSSPQLLSGAASEDEEARRRASTGLLG